MKFSELKSALWELGYGLDVMHQNTVFTLMSPYPECFPVGTVHVFMEGFLKDWNKEHSTKDVDDLIRAFCETPIEDRGINVVLCKKMFSLYEREREKNRAFWERQKRLKEAESMGSIEND